VKTSEVSVAESGMRLDRWVKKNYPDITFVFLQKLLRKGGIKVDSKKAKPEQKLETGQQISIIEFERREKTVKEKPPISAAMIERLQKAVIYKDENILAINKPPGLAAQGGTNVKESVDEALDFLKFGLDERPRLVHRIDKDTSGVMLLARNRKSAVTLGKMFKEKGIKKTYWALTAKVPENIEGKISAPLAAKSSDGYSEKTSVDASGKKAITMYRVKEKVGEVAFVELEPLTGRMHQLRAHMAYIGCPILSDGKYGGREAFITGLSDKMHLHARSIEFKLSGKKIFVTAPMPEHMLESFKMLGLE